MHKFSSIPVVNDFTLFRRVLASVDSLVFGENIIVNNSGSPLPESLYADRSFRVWGNKDKLRLTDTQNAMRNYAISSSFDLCAFMHSDGEVFDGTGCRLVQMIEPVLLSYDDSVRHSIKEEVVLASGRRSLCEAFVP